MNRLRERFEPVALLLFRLAVGVVMIAHGWDKVVDRAEWIGNLRHMGVPMPKVSVWLAIAGELGGGLGVLVGLLTPLAALGIVFSMLTAILSVHLKNGLLARNGGFEYPLTLLAAGVYLFAKGAGPISLDRLVWRKK